MTPLYISNSTSMYQIKEGKALVSQAEKSAEKLMKQFMPSLVLPAINNH